MLSLNLISDELKNEIKLRRLYLFIKKIGLVLITIAIFTATILLTAKIILQIKFNDTVNQMTLVTKNNQGYNNKVRVINGKINFAEKVQNDFVPWSNALKIISEITPIGINLNYLKINLGEQSVKIKGKAGLRENLLDFKQNMENSEIFKDIDFPIKNILEKENIDFEINSKINYERL
ncbi:MAG: PilN domain-containing protein [bacterium]